MASVTTARGWTESFGLVDVLQLLLVDLGPAGAERDDCAGIERRLEQAVADRHVRHGDPEGQLHVDRLRAGRELGQRGEQHTHRPRLLGHGSRRAGEGSRADGVLPLRPGQGAEDLHRRRVHEAHARQGASPGVAAVHLDPHQLAQPLRVG